MFSKENDQYVFSHLGKDIYETKSLGVIISPSPVGFFLQKHGPPASIKEWRETALKKISTIDPFASQDYIYVETDSCCPKELNKMLNTTGYIPKELLEKIKKSMN